jgi:pimeloyl-ACP methyl ester carboxylesterase
MYSRKKVQFNATDLTLRGWFYTPAQLQQKMPAIIMTPGFSALKEHHYEAFALTFVHAGFCVLLYDNRNFGESDSTTRLEIDPVLQIQDMSHAITFLQNQTEVCEDKIGLWGSSFSGGIVLAVAAKDERVGCVVAQVPLVEGYHRILQQEDPKKLAALQKKFAVERERIKSGQPPVMISVVTSDPEKTAVMKQPTAYQFFTSIPFWENKVTLKSVENAGEFSPIDRMEEIAPIPLLFIVADQDTVNSPELARKAFAKALPPKKIMIVQGGHFDPHGDLFGICSKEACEWFLSYLTVRVVK